MIRCRRFLGTFRWGMVAALAWGLVLAAPAMNRPNCPPIPSPVPGPPPPPPPGKPCRAKEPPCDKCQNSPVFTRSGVPTFSAADLSVPGPGLPLALTRHYLASSRFAGLAGFGWMTPFEERISEETDGTACRAVLLMQDGRTAGFVASSCAGAASFASEEGNPWTLYRSTAGVWTLYKEDGSFQVFDAQGFLQTMTGPGGESLVLAYAAGSVLDSVYDPKRPSRVLHFGVTGGFVTSAWDGAGRTVSYSQDANGDLVSVTGPDGWAARYEYTTGDAGFNPAALCSVPHLVKNIYQQAPDGTPLPSAEASSYDAAFRLQSQAAQGRPVAWSYPAPSFFSGAAYATRETWADADGLAQAKTLLMDEFGRIVKAERADWDGYNWATRFFTRRVYDTAGDLAYTQDEAGLWTRTDHDASGNVTRVVRDYCDASYCGPGAHLNLAWDYSYTTIANAPRLTEIAGPAGYAHTKMDYYPTTGVQANGDEGVAGRLWRMKRVNEDASEDVLAAYTYASGSASPAFGQVKSVTAGGAVTEYSYDSATGALVGVTLPKNGGATNPAVGYTVDALYQVTQVTDQAGAVTALLYDSAGRTSEVKPPDPATGAASAAFRTQFAYGAVEPAATFNVDTSFDGVADPLLKSSVTDPNGRTTERFSDADGKVWRVKDAAGSITKYDYFPGGLLKSITDANGNVTSYTYDGFDRLASVTDPYGKVTSYTYYLDGKLQSRTDGKSQSIFYLYDNAGRLTEKRYGANTAAAPHVAFSYKDTSVTPNKEYGDRIFKVTDTYHTLNGASQTYTYGYDTRHRLISVASPTGAVTYTYQSDTIDRIASVTDSADSSKVWNYTYYDDGSLHTIAAPEGTYTYFYTPVGQVDHVTYPNNSTVQYAYDLQHRLTQIQNAATTSPLSLISQYDYAYDQGTGPDAKPMKGMISSATERFKHTDQALYGPYTTNYGYDQLYQLTSAAHPAFDPLLNIPWSNQTHAFTYDPIGNRTTYQKKDNATQNVLDLAAYAYNLANKGPQLAGITHTNGEPSLSFAYDASGNTATQTVNSTTPATTTYTWDQDDKMTGMSSNDTPQTVNASFVYAYNGDRLQRTLNNVTWTYLYDREDILKANQAGAAMYMTQGPGIDDVLAETVGSATSYAYKNMLSSVLQLADAGAAVNRNYNYSAWGESTNWPVPGVDNNPYAYTGRESDAPGVLYYRARAYQPEVGRFLSFRGAVKLFEGYNYVYNNPLVLRDPQGHQIDPVTGGIIVAGICIFGMACAPSQGEPPQCSHCGAALPAGWDQVPAFCEDPPCQADKRKCCRWHWTIADWRCHLYYGVAEAPECQRKASEALQRCLGGMSDRDNESQTDQQWPLEPSLWSWPSKTWGAERDAPLPPFNPNPQRAQ